MLLTKLSGRGKWSSSLSALCKSPRGGDGTAPKNITHFNLGLHCMINPCGYSPSFCVALRLHVSLHLSSNLSTIHMCLCLCMSLPTSVTIEITLCSFFAPLLNKGGYSSQWRCCPFWSLRRFSLYTCLSLCLSPRPPAHRKWRVIATIDWRLSPGGQTGSLGSQMSHGIIKAIHSSLIP